MTYTKHALNRCQDRGIPPIVHTWLDAYGAEKYDGRGGVIVHFDKKSIKRMESDFGKHFVRENKKYLRMYRVESAKDSRIITCGHRYKRLRN